MADYRKRLVDMTDEERAEVAPGSPQFSEDYENVDDPLSVQMMEAGLDFTPVGTAKGISDIKDELSRDDPNYLKAIGMGAVEAAALIPGAAPVLKGMVKGSLGNTKKIITSKKDLGFDMGEPYDYDLTLKMEDIIDEWASGDINNPKLRKKLGELDITLGNRIGPKADPSTLEIQMPDGRVFYGTGDVPSTPRPKSLDLPPAENAARTQIAGTLPTYKKADSLLTELSGEGKTLDFGAGLGLSKKELGFDTYEPFPKEGFKPDFNNPSEIPSNAYKKITNLNVLNVVPKDVRDTIVKDIGRILEPGGRAVITTRGRDVMAAKGKPGPEEMSIITTKDTYQKGFTQPELKTYIQETLGESFDVVNNKLGAAGVTVHKLPTKGYAEGGAVMDEQMEMAFGDAGERVDPVSGNEVPTGSLPEEVRDDIPAQLSEGEYVVPADVVRYYGVKFFEDLRTEAKTGFADMEANGRIGGDPIDGMEVIEPEDDLPFDISELQVEDDEQPVMMNEGGVVSTPFSSASSTRGFEIKEYVNDAGEVLYVQFMNGEPMTFIPEGYKVKATAAEEVSEGTSAPADTLSAPETSVSTSEKDSRAAARSRAAMDPAFTQGKSGTDWTSATADEFASTTKNLGFGGKVASSAIGALNVPLGIASGIASGSSSRNKAYDMLDGIAYQLESGSLSDSQKTSLLTQQADLQKFLDPTSKKPGPMTNLLKATGVFGGNSTMYENLSDNTGDGRVSFADTWLGDFLGGDGKFGIQATDEDGNRLTLGSDRYRGADVYEGKASSAQERVAARKKSPYEKSIAAARAAESSGNKEEAKKQYGSAASIASKALTDAYNMVQNTSTDDPGWAAAIKAQSDASKALTAAKQKETGRTGIFGLSNDDDD